MGKPVQGKKFVRLKPARRGQLRSHNFRPFGLLVTRLGYVCSFPLKDARPIDQSERLSGSCDVMTCYVTLLVNVNLFLMKVCSETVHCLRAFQLKCWVFPVNQ